MDSGETGTSGCLVDAVAQDEPISQQQHDSDRQHSDDRKVELSAGVISDRLSRVDLAFALQTFRREFIEPGKRHPKRKTDPGRDQKPARRPFRRAERRPQLRDALRERPDRADIEDRRADDIAAL